MCKNLYFSCTAGGRRCWPVPEGDAHVWRVHQGGEEVPQPRGRDHIQLHQGMPHAVLAQHCYVLLDRAI